MEFLQELLHPITLKQAAFSLLVFLMGIAVICAKDWHKKRG
jgi:hypothetical protein